MSNFQRNRSFRWVFLVPLLAIVAIAAVGIGLSLYFHATSPSSGPPYYYGWPFFGFGWFFFIPVIFLIFFGFRWFFWGSWGWGYYGRHYYDSAMETLRERYARGEITKEQFEEMARKLEES